MGVSQPVPVTRKDPARPTPGDSLVDAPLPASDQRRRVSRVLVLRTLVVSVVLGLSVWLLIAGPQASRTAVYLQSGILAATYLSLVVFWVMLRVGVSPRVVVKPMHLVDLAVTSALVLATGGAQSPYTFLYALSIVSAGALSYRRGATVVTLGSIISMIAVAMIAWLRIIDVPTSTHPWEQSTGDFARTLGIQVATLIGVGTLAFIFGDQLQRGAETLATTRQAAADLLTLHQDIVRSLASGLITISPTGTVLTANHAASEILGKPVHEMVGLSLENSMPGLLQRLRDARGEMRRDDLALGKLTVGVTVSPLRDLRDRVIGSVVNFQDLTELRRLETDMRRAERLATVGQLAAGIAHEIRNPLASISGSVELLRSAPNASEDDRTLMNIVHREIQRLNELIGDLLDYSSPKPSHPIEMDLAVLVREIVQVARTDKAFAEIEVGVEVDEPLLVTADPGKLRQVVWNLLRNAADAAIEGGKHVRVEARADGELACSLTVSDDGKGIPEAELGRIFDPFYTTKKKGTGLGLATCHAIVAEHHGRITATSDVGKGTKMVVTLPRGGLRSTA